MTRIKKITLLTITTITLTTGNATQPPPIHLYKQPENPLLIALMRDIRKPLKEALIIYTPDFKNPLNGKELALRSNENEHRYKLSLWANGEYLGYMDIANVILHGIRKHEIPDNPIIQEIHRSMIALDDIDSNIIQLWNQGLMRPFVGNPIGPMQAFITKATTGGLSSHVETLSIAPPIGRPLITQETTKIMQKLSETLMSKSELELTVILNETTRVLSQKTGLKLGVIAKDQYGRIITEITNYH